MEKNTEDIKVYVKEKVAAAGFHVIDEDNYRLTLEDKGSNRVVLDIEPHDRDLFGLFVEVRCNGINEELLVSQIMEVWDDSDAVRFKYSLENQVAFLILNKEELYNTRAPYIEKYWVIDDLDVNKLF